ncbi:uncharacterized protein LOC128680415 [Plodia interpunctella]|uniref:uncharacterized protein LOC128680415 n=1 Tax=Plodia interpunctella TaxID=58824 RepID=UPI002368823C|nr:uncharacterized protein LOC128680415 [Plodia interpunctella]
MLLTIMATACMVVTTQLHKHLTIHVSSLEEITSAILFGILGMSIILSILLLVAGCQKDVAMLRLYNCYMVGTTLAALVPAFVLMSRMRTMEVCGAFAVILMQCYVIVLVRSEVVKLEKKVDAPRTPSRDLLRLGHCEDTRIHKIGVGIST